MYRYYSIGIIVTVVVGIAVFGGLFNEKSEEAIHGAKEVELMPKQSKIPNDHQLEEKIENESKREPKSEQKVSESNNRGNVNKEPEKKESTKTEITPSQKEEQIAPKEPEQETIIPTIDLELEGLKASCDTFDYSECFIKAGDVASTDIENIRNTSCEDVIYKGEIIGQRILIFYRDGTWKYNKTTN